MKNKPAYIMRDNSITVFVDGQPHTIESSNPNFRELRQAIFDAKYDKIPSLLSVKNKIVSFSHGELRAEGDKLFWKNHQLHGVVVDKLFELLGAGAKDASPLLNFIQRLLSNPSANSVDQLYTFLSYKSLPITPEGKFIAYKGVKNDFYSKQGNTNTVVVRGTVNASGEICNRVGETIEVARRSVDDNKDNHCSFGLHVGSYDYASGWAGSDGRLLVVEVDPADAVSVPTDCEFQKMRVSKYTVIGDITEDRKEIPAAVYNGSDDCLYDFDSNLDNCTERMDDSEIEADDELKADIALDMILLKIANYIDEKHKRGIDPTVKQIQSRMKGYNLSSQQIVDYAVHNLGYQSAYQDENVSNILILPAF